ncbi:MAG: N-6 DNA Methylase [Methanoregulaceae archaeon PtaU1.Bin066]|nr:MAG: N-6 DNA Methylase [Methanoregulaceae archaeon PtaU1.Bin066]
MENFNEKVNLIWSIAELIRGPYRPNQYKDVILPLIVLRRLDCVLEPTKKEVLAAYESHKEGKITNLEPLLNKVSGFPFHNTSRFTFKELKDDPNDIAHNLTQYIKGFSSRARDIIEHFGFEEHIAKLDRANRLYLVVKRFYETDLHPDRVSNLEMGYIFEELIRRFNEASNEEAGDHFTPREVIHLMVNLLFLTDNDVLTKKNIIRTLYDPACGTGGMLSISDEYLRKLNPDAHLEVFGQDYNDQAYAICGSDMMIKGQSLDNIYCGDSFTDDHFTGKHFDYMLANPPFGVEWKPEEEFIKKEHQQQGFGGRFGAGLPPINDGAFLFLQHMISKMKPPDGGGTRLAIVFNGSPLFTGSAGSGPSEIRRWIIENDWLEAIVALPDQLFYNTGISTYLWIVTNRKSPSRRGKIQLVDARTFFKKMRKSLGNKRNEICEEQRDIITRLYGEFQENEFVRVFDNADFGYSRITVEQPLRLNFAVTDERIARLKETPAFVNLAESKKRKDKDQITEEVEEGRRKQEAILAALEPLRALGVVKSRESFADSLKASFRKSGVIVPAALFKSVLMALSEQDETAGICLDSKGKPEPDSSLRDYENVPLKEDIGSYMAREVLPHVPDAWVDESKTKVGYEINFNRYFYTYTPPRPLDEIEADLKVLEEEIASLLKEMI